MNENCHITCPQCGQINRLPAVRLNEQPNCGSCSQRLLDGRAQSLDDTTVERFLRNNDLPIVVDFWADWCGPCKAMAPTFTHMAERLKGRALFAKLDTDAAPDTARRYNIRSIPTLIVFAGGRELARQSGALDAGRMRSFIDAALADA